MIDPNVSERPFLKGIDTERTKPLLAFSANLFLLDKQRRLKLDRVSLPLDLIQDVRFLSPRA